jgi:hypothetical protein
VLWAGLGLGFESAGAGLVLAGVWTGAGWRLGWAAAGLCWVKVCDGLVERLVWAWVLNRLGLGWFRLGSGLGLAGGWAGLLLDCAGLSSVMVWWNGFSGLVA